MLVAQVKYTQHNNGNLVLGVCGTWILSGVVRTAHFTHEAGVRLLALALTFAREALDVEMLVLHLEHFARAVGSTGVTRNGCRKNREERVECGSHGEANARS